MFFREIFAFFRETHDTKFPEKIKNFAFVASEQNTKKKSQKYEIIAKRFTLLAGNLSSKLTGIIFDFRGKLLIGNKSAINIKLIDILIYKFFLSAQRNALC